MSCILVALWCAQVASTDSREAAAAGSFEKPAVLEYFEQMRYGISAEFSVREYTAANAPYCYRSIVQGDQILLHVDGPADVIWRSDDGQEVRDLQRGVLLNTDGTWVKSQRMVPGEHGDRYREEASDFRCVGMTPLYDCLRGSPLDATASAFSQQAGQVRYREYLDDDGLDVVEATGTINGVEASTVWYLDPALGYNAVRVDQVYKGAVVRSVFTDYEVHNGYPVPVKATFTMGDLQPAGVIEIKYSKVNTPDIPHEFSPRDIGFLEGNPVFVEGQPQMIWAGGRLLHGEEWRELLAKGEVSLDPELARLYREAKERFRSRQAASAPAGAPASPGTPPASAPTASAPTASAPAASAPASRPALVFTERERLLDAQVEQSLKPELDDWDKYVLEFIRRYQLNADQTEKCRQLLKDAKERRDAHLKRRADDIGKLKGGKYKSEGDMKLAEERLNVLLRPVRQTFEGLKARLMKIPTRKQLDEAAPADGKRESAADTIRR